MHRQFRKALEDATGQSEFVVAVNVDIRDFTPFSKKTESPNTAMFIKRVYMTLIDEYFQDASFFKPAGDGLLVTIPYSEHTLRDVVRNTVDTCLALVKRFKTICKGDPMINFEVPQQVGIGLARGTVSRLESKGKILDYSGTVLNKASRFMEMARPAGIVFDADFGAELLLKKKRSLFAKEKVFIRGFAESDPIKVFFTKRYTDIPSVFMRPIQSKIWAKQVILTTLTELKKFTSFYHNLDKEPLDPSKIRLKVTHSRIHKGKPQKDYDSIFDYKGIKYLDDAGKPQLKVDYDGLVQKLHGKGVTPRMKITLQILYPEA